MFNTHKITCLFGIEYETEITGTKEEIKNTIEHLTSCCCLMCANKECPIDRKQIYIGNAHMCQDKRCMQHTSKPYCDISRHITHR